MDQAMEVIAGEPPVKALFPTRLRGRYSPIGLDLGSSQVKLIQFKQEQRRVVCISAGSTTARGAITAGRITDAAPLIEGWLDSKRRRFIGTGPIFASVARRSFCAGCSCRRWRRANSPRAPLRGGEGIMIPYDEAVIDYIALGEHTAEGNVMLDLAVVAAPKDVINDYLGVVTRVGLYPDVIEIESFALQRMLPFVYPAFAGPSGEALMLLDIGGESSNLVLFDEGGFRFARTLNIGMNHFCRRIEENRDIGTVAARSLLLGQDSFAVEGVQETADELVEEIRRSLEFYLYSIDREHKEIETICLCGGGSAIDRLPSFIGFELKVEPVVLNPIDFIETGRRFIRKDLEREGHLLNVAAGLALRGWLR